MPKTREDVVLDFIIKSGSREVQSSHLRYLETIIGPIACSNLLRMSSEIFVSPRNYQLLIEGCKINSRIVTDKTRVRPDFKDYYLESDFNVLLDDWLILLSVFELAPESKEYHKQDGQPEFQKIIQIDFMFLDDYLDTKTNARKAYKHVKRGQAIDGHGLVSSSIQFLKQLRQFVKSIDQNCLVRAYPSDAQRARIYKAALKDMPNVSIEFGKK